MTFEPMTFEPMAFDLMTELMTFELMTFELLFSLKQITWALGGLLQKGYNLVGPVAPFLSLIGLLEGVLLLFLLSLPLWTTPRRRRAEKGFLVHLEKGNGALSNIAIVTGFVGTYWGLMNTLPVLATIVEGGAAEGTTGRMLSGLGTAFVSSMVGLGLGGILGSVNGYLLDVLVPEEDSPEDSPEEKGPEEGSLEESLGLGSFGLAAMLPVSAGAGGYLPGALVPEEDGPEEGSPEEASRPGGDSREKFQTKSRAASGENTRGAASGAASGEDARGDARLLQAVEQALASDTDF